MQLPTPNAIVARALPNGIPALRDELIARTGLFSTSLDPEAAPGDPGLFGPDSATWKLVGQPSQALAGLRAALLQAASPSIPTATHSTGAFADDFMGRVVRTGRYVEAQNLGSMDEVYRTARRVRAMHRTVKGAWKDGQEFDASDVEEQAWVSMTLTDSYLVMTERFGSGRIPRDLADRFVREQSTHAALLDHRVDLDEIFDDPARRAALQAGLLPLPAIDDGLLPTTRQELRDLMQAFTPRLGTTQLTRTLLDLTVDLSEVPDPQRRLIRPFVLATLSTIPDEWHEVVAPGTNRIEEHLAAQAVQYAIALLQAVVGRARSVEAAEARMSGTRMSGAETAGAA